MASIVDKILMIGAALEDERLPYALGGQTRLWWEQTPVDIFLDSTDFHRQVARRRQFHEFGGSQVPFLGCSDLAVFRAFVNRSKDWADLEEMMAIGALDVDRVLGVLVRYLGGDDDHLGRLRQLTAPGGWPPSSSAPGRQVVPRAATGRWHTRPAGVTMSVWSGGGYLPRSGPLDLRSGRSGRPV